MKCKNLVSWSIVLVLSWLTTALPAAEQQSPPPPKQTATAAKEEEPEPPLLTRVYHVPVASLRVAGAKPYSGDRLPSIGTENAGLSLGAGGMGGGAGGPGAPRATVSDERPLAVFESRGGREERAAKQARPKMGLVVEQPSQAQLCIEDLIDIIIGTVSPTSWDTTGGAGSITYYNGIFIVSQTEAVHRELKGLLPQLLPATSLPMVTIEAYWLLLDSSQLQSLASRKKEPDAKTRNTVDPKALEELLRSAPGYRGQITCFSGQTVYLASGERRTVVLSAIPVVGSGIGYQPVTSLANVGAVLQVTPSLLPGSESALIDVDSLVTGWGDLPPFQLQTDSPAHEITEGNEFQRSTEKVPGRGTRLQVDRLRMPTHQLATTLRVPLGKPVLVGGLTLEPVSLPVVDPKEGQKKQLYLILRTSVCEE